MASAHGRPTGGGSRSSAAACAATGCTPCAATGPSLRRLAAQEVRSPAWSTTGTNAFVNYNDRSGKAVGLEDGTYTDPGPTAPAAAAVRALQGPRPTTQLVARREQDRLRCPPAHLHDGGRRSRAAAADRQLRRQRPGVVAGRQAHRLHPRPRPLHHRRANGRGRRQSSRRTRPRARPLRPLDRGDRTNLAAAPPLAPQALLRDPRPPRAGSAPAPAGRWSALSMLLARTVQHEPAGRNAADHHRGGRAHPVARVADVASSQSASSSAAASVSSDKLRSRRSASAFVVPPARAPSGRGVSTLLCVTDGSFPPLRLLLILPLVGSIALWISVLCVCFGAGGVVCVIS